MTVPEYIQLRAFARIDGLKLFGLWLASFVCYVGALRTPGLEVLAMLLAVLTPFFSYRLLRRFRDDGLNGVISFKRGWAYVAFQFFYASLLFAIAQFIYFAYIDKGSFLTSLVQRFNDPQTLGALKQMGLGDSMLQALDGMRSMRPIDLVLNIMTSNLFIGVVLGLPIAGFAKRSCVEKVN